MELRSRVIGRPLRRIGATARLEWSALSGIGRVSIAGVVASGALALALGVAITRTRETTASRARSTSSSMTAFAGACWVVRTSA